MLAEPALEAGCLFIVESQAEVGAAPEPSVEPEAAQPAAETPAGEDTPKDESAG